MNTLYIMPSTGDYVSQLKRIESELNAIMNDNSMSELDFGLVHDAYSSVRCVINRNRSDTTVKTGKGVVHGR